MSTRHNCIGSQLGRWSGQVYCRPTGLYAIISRQRIDVITCITINDSALKVNSTYLTQL